MSTLHRFGLTRMTGRDPDQAHRAASSLELLFDLVFVIAVSVSSSALHHLETDGRLGLGVGSYLMVFFAIWWAWMNFTWFATSFDTDDWLYRVTTIVQMGGAMVIAIGAGAAIERGDFALVTIGYAGMRLPMVAQWLRAAAGAPRYRRAAVRYAGAIAFVQLLWVLRLLLPHELGVPAFFVLAASEMLIPVFAEAAASTPTHLNHIAERYGLFTLILLGESLLASANAVIDGLAHADHVVPLAAVAASGLGIAAGLWWLYFSREQAGDIVSFSTSLVFGYTHYFIFAAAGALSAGIEVAIDLESDSAHLSSFAAAGTLTIPVAAFVLGVWALSLRRSLSSRASAAVVACGALILVATLLPFAAVAAALLVALAVAAVVVDQTVHAPSRPREQALVDD